MLLTIDIGNSNIVIGCFSKTELLHVFRLRTDLERTADEYEALLFSLLRAKFGAELSFTRCIIASVVPPITADIVRLVKDAFSLTPLIVGPGIKTGMSLKVIEPAAVGADRVVNAVAAKHLYGSPAMVVDFGTATSIDYINEAGEYEGGAIIPGAKISLEALTQHTAKLPKIELEWPQKVIGKSTVLAMQSGAVVGYLCLIDGLLKKMQKETGVVKHKIATGGLGAVFVERSDELSVYAPTLTLSGLRIIADLNA